MNNNLLVPITKQEFHNYYEKISQNFRNTLEIKPEIEKEITSTYENTLSEYAKITLNMIKLEYFKMFENLIEFHGKKKESLEFSDLLIDFIIPYFDKLENRLNIKNKRDLEELTYILDLSLIIMEDAVKNKDFEMAHESFFQIERRVQRSNLIKKSVKES